jgi:hypothetical protein
MAGLDPAIQVLPDLVLLADWMAASRMAMTERVCD